MVFDTNNVIVDGSALSGEFAIFTANGLKGIKLSELKSDLVLTYSDITNLSNWSGSSNITTLRNYY